MAVVAGAQLCALSHLAVNALSTTLHPRSPTFEVTYQTLIGLSTSLKSLETDLVELEGTPKFNHRIRAWILSENLKRFWRNLRKADDRFQTEADESGMAEDPVLSIKNIVSVEEFVSRLGTKWKGLHRRFLKVEEALPPTRVLNAVTRVGDAARRVMGK